jgi:ABC-type antimicrobial peptide transport system permease subunit
LPEFYRPFMPGSVQLSLNVRCAGTCPSQAQFTQRIMTVHPALQVHRVQRLDDVYAEQTGRPRAVAAVSGTLAVIALVAAAAGFVGVLSYAVGLRRREFGIRAALGASRSSLWALVFADGFRVVSVGMAFGMLAAWWLARATAALHFGVTATDPWTWVMVGLVVLAATVAAVWYPAREAGRADPTMLLKSE